MDAAVPDEKAQEERVLLDRAYDLRVSRGEGARAACMWVGAWAACMRRVRELLACGRARGLHACGWVRGLHACGWVRGLHACGRVRGLHACGWVCGAMQYTIRYIGISSYDILLCNIFMYAYRYIYICVQARRVNMAILSATCLPGSTIWAHSGMTGELYVRCCAVLYCTILYCIPLIVSRVWPGIHCLHSKLPCKYCNKNNKINEATRAWIKEAGRMNHLMHSVP